MPNRRCLSEDRGDDAMNEPTMETLAGRLDRVEQENRWLKQAGVVALAVIAAVVLMGQATGSKVVEAQRFILRDSKGINRGGLQVMDDGRPILHLADENGLTRAELVVLSNNTPALYFYDYERGRDVDRKHLAWLGVSKHGSVTLALIDRERQSQAQLSGTGPRLRFIGKDGRVIWSAP